MKHPDAAFQDHLESQSLYDLLEKQIVPLFYQRGVDKIQRTVIPAARNRRRDATGNGESDSEICFVAGAGNLVLLPSVLLRVLRHREIR